jgi:hypothetical protein
MDETKQEICDRRQKEFDRKLQLGIPIEQPKYPAYVELMDAKDTIKKLTADLIEAIGMVLDKEVQIKRLQKESLLLSELMLSANNKWLESCSENKKLVEDLIEREDTNA